MDSQGRGDGAVGLDSSPHRPCIVDTRRSGAELYPSKRLNAVPCFQHVLLFHRLDSFFVLVGPPMLRHLLHVSRMLTPRSPFLAFVSSTQQFDTQLSQYVNSSYVQEKYNGEMDISLKHMADQPSRYQRLLGCGNVNLTNTTNLYARYTVSVICNAIVQNSIKPCALSSAESPPLCAESCVSNHIFVYNPLLIVHRLNKQPVRRKSQSIISSATALNRATWTRYGPTLQIVPFPATL